GLGTFVSVDAMRVGSGSVQPTPAVVYGWRSVPYAPAYGGSYAVSDQMRAQVSFMFRGTGIDWYSVFSAYGGKAGVYLDGTLIKTADTYKSSTALGRISLRGLSDGLHTLRVVALGTRSTASKGTMVTVDRFVVF